MFVLWICMNLVFVIERPCVSRLGCFCSTVCSLRNHTCKSATAHWTWDTCLQRGYDQGKKFKLSHRFVKNKADVLNVRMFLLMGRRVVCSSAIGHIYRQLSTSAQHSTAVSRYQKTSLLDFLGVECQRKAGMARARDKKWWTMNMIDDRWPNLQPCSTGFLFPECVVKGSRLTWESEGIELCSPLFSCPQPSATVRNRSRVFESEPYGTAVGRALKSDFSWRCHVCLRCYSIVICKKWHVMQERWCISLHRRSVSWKWHVCVAVILGWRKKRTGDWVRKGRPGGDSQDLRFAREKIALLTVDRGVYRGLE